MAKARKGKSQRETLFEMARGAVSRRAGESLATGLSAAIQSIPGPGALQALQSEVPMLRPVQPPRRRRRRPSDPFDFFGTLFTDPATQGLNPVIALNEMV